MPLSTLQLRTPQYRSRGRQITSLGVHGPSHFMRRNTSAGDLVSVEHTCCLLEGRALVAVVVIRGNTESCVYTIKYIVSSVPPANRHGNEGSIVRESTPAPLFMVMVLQYVILFSVSSFMRLDLDIIVKFES